MPAGEWAAPARLVAAAFDDPRARCRSTRIHGAPSGTACVRSTRGSQAASRTTLAQAPDASKASISAPRILLPWRFDNGTEVLATPPPSHSNDRLRCRTGNSRSFAHGFLFLTPFLYRARSLLAMPVTAAGNLAGSRHLDSSKIARLSCPKNGSSGHRWQSSETSNRVGEIPEKWPGKSPSPARVSGARFRRNPENARAIILLPYFRTIAQRESQAAKNSTNRRGQRKRKHGHRQL